MYVNQVEESWETLDETQETYPIGQYISLLQLVCYLDGNHHPVFHVYFYSSSRRAILPHETFSFSFYSQGEV